MITITYRACLSYEDPEDFGAIKRIEDRFYKEVETDMKQGSSSGTPASYPYLLADFDNERDAEDAECLMQTIIEEEGGEVVT